MYFKRVERLDLPTNIQLKLLQEWESSGLQYTSHSGAVVQYQPTGVLQQEIYTHYQSFLNLVPDIPKIHIKKIHSKHNRVLPHTDKLQTTSITCIIKTDALIPTLWYEARNNFKHLYQTHDVNFKNIKGIDYVPNDHIDTVADVVLKPWEMILFDHNSIHSVENFIPNMERILFSIGFLNIEHDDLVECYDKWLENDISNI